MTIPDLRQALSSLSENRSNNNSNNNNEINNNKINNSTNNSTNNNSLSECNKLNFLDIAIYIGIVMIFIKSVNSEYKDIYGKSSEIPEGKYYINGKPDNSDTIEKILSKINILSDTYNNTVKWRRSLIVSIFSSIIISIFSFKKFPSGKEFLLIVLPIFVSFYASFNYYSYHYDKYPSDYIKQNVTNLEKKLHKLTIDNKKKKD